MTKKLINSINEKLLETFIIIVNLVCDTILLLVALACFKILDASLNYLGYESEILASIVHQIHFLILIVLGALSIDNIFITPKSIKSSPTSKRTFELIQKNDIKHEISNSTENERNSDINNQNKISNLDNGFAENDSTNLIDSKE